MVYFAQLDESVSPRVEPTDIGHNLFDQLDMTLNGDSMVERCIEEDKSSNREIFSHITEKLQEKLQFPDRNSFERAKGQAGEKCSCDSLPSPAETFDVIFKGESWLRETLETALVDREPGPPVSRAVADASQPLEEQGESAIDAKEKSSPKIQGSIGAEGKDALSVNVSSSCAAECVDGGGNVGPVESSVEVKATEPKTDIPGKKKRKAGSELKARRKPPRHWPLPNQSRVATRANPHTLLLADIHEETCPVRRWSCSGRPDRPEYPACMEGVLEAPPETESLTEVEDDDSSSSEAASDAAPSETPDDDSYTSRLESCIVPGTLEAVVTFCRTSPLLPAPLKPQPDHLRALLHDSCVLQCILRGVQPSDLAEYLDSAYSGNGVSDFRDLSDVALFTVE
ncbi:uncharacterized protein LOC124163688 [Ischnura elegans]|uniref:uncharacterized protein LOC124163688 n=1 Tax=Ischnura elegans TaxID=197161 RepID=UPI001ED874DB|nr:uncharacterized protein LOC124163688 [Ischnura elegans]